MNRLRSLSVFLPITLLFLFSGCSSRHLSESKADTIVYPSPPATARIQYLTSYSSSKDIEPEQSAFTKSIVGEKDELPITKPYGIFIRNGKIYICDVGLGGGLGIIDLQKEEMNYFIPRGENQLQLPINCYVDTNNQLFVVDAKLKKVMVYDGQGKYVSSFGKSESEKPTDIFISQNKIWVSDFNNNRINVYNRETFKFEYFIPDYEEDEEGYLYKPSNIHVTADKVYVSDMGSGNIKVYSHEGELLETIGKFGRNLGEFVRPKGIAVDQEENLFVVDASFENVQIFNEEGALLLFFGGPYNGPGDMWLPTKVRVDYDNMEYFEKYVDPKYDLKYLILVANQYGPGKISVYGRIEVKPDKKNSG